ncbi:hypothetical protein [Methylicorpusculum sp.]|uniref:hypothetical protein n=1 Tax=Methylicorpusculum sp. TaxID=2713644 RepID=UPI00272F3990|nr:hypothetical protein [Methylicorpusculum sp.]MDP2179604.1 hypothetical protein [Methylicorpusculum sp.]MDZ4154184.1 hypothetical protein [Methylicorpusculum sp.]
MIALLYFVFFFLIYLPISIWVIRKSYQFAKANYQRGWLGGLVAALIMYNLVFWDWIPVILIHKYLCETEGGFWVYKTPEQWVKEHPEVLGQDWGNNFRIEAVRKDFGNRLQRNWFDSSIYKEISQRSEIDFTKTINRREIKIVDANTNEILFKSVNFSRIAPYKLWLSEPSQSEGPGCSKSANNGAVNEFAKMKKLVKGDKK